MLDLPFECFDWDAANIARYMHRKEAERYEETRTKTQD